MGVDTISAAEYLRVRDEWHLKPYHRLNDSTAQQSEEEANALLRELVHSASKLIFMNGGQASRVASVLQGQFCSTAHEQGRY